ncbi:MAG: RNA 2',3'-cyclic phosphodiesterase [Acidimicrobiia bacterium]|nr:RNA 2',3'-cyclic phosphodiesterase [Acidimicrobiia bacterium]
MVGSVGRLFIGVDLRSDTRQALAALLTEHAQGRLPGRVVPPMNWHLTLRFLGEVGAVEFDRLLMELASARLGAPFDIGFDGLGAFPRSERATVLWVGINEGESQLQRLAGVVEEGVAGAGFPSEDRPFRAHLTLSRIRPPQDVSTLIAGTSPVRVRMLVDEVTLFRSHLEHGETRYEVLESFGL